jgi:MFS family permease
MSYLSSIKNIIGSKNLMVITLTQSLFMLTATLWWPYWSLYILNMTQSKTLVGITFMVELVAQLILQFPGGILTDRLGRKKMIVLGSIFRAISPIIYVTTRSWYFVMLGMITTQASNMLNPAVNALIAESIDVENRALGYGAFRMLILFPTIFTPYIGGVITDRLGVDEGVRLAVMMSLAVAILNIFVRWRFLEEPERRPRVLDEKTRMGAFKIFRNVPTQIRLIIIVGAFANFALMVSSQFMVVYATQVLNLTKTQWGLITTVAGAISTFLTLPISYYSDRLGRKPIIALSLAIAPLQMLGFILAKGFQAIAASRVIGAIADGFGGTMVGLASGSAWLALVADVAPSHQRGSMMGLITTITGFLSFYGPTLGGYIYDNISPMMPFLTSGISSLAAALVFIIFIKEPKTREE